jgi:hypothetical protein
VKGLRQVGAHDLETANQYLQQIYLPLWNRRFRRQARLAGNAHRALLPGNESGLGAELSGKSYGKPGSHGSLARGDYRVEREQIAAAMRGARVQLEPTMGWKHVDALAKTNPGTRSLWPSHAHRFTVLASSQLDR